MRVTLFAWFTAVCLIAAESPCGAQCPDVHNVFRADTLNGLKVGEGSPEDLTGIALQQKGCVLTGSFSNVLCGLTRQLSITLDQGHNNGSVTITHSFFGKTVVLRGTANVTKQSLSWTITSIEPPTLAENGIADSPFTETRTFVAVREGEVVASCK